jgi:hypothetical protein
MKLSESLKINTENIRIRDFTMAGQKLRVRVPLSSEMDDINKKVEATDWSHKRKEMIEPMFAKKEELESEKIVFEDDDVIFDGKSMKALAKATAQTETRITEMIKLLVPVQEGTDMSETTYEEINAEFPFSIQLELMKKIIEVISPSYEETRKN